MDVAHAQYLGYASSRLHLRRAHCVRLGLRRRQPHGSHARTQRLLVMIGTARISFLEHRGPWRILIQSVPPWRVVSPVSYPVIHTARITPSSSVIKFKRLICRTSEAATRDKKDGYAPLYTVNGSTSMCHYSSYKCSSMIC